MILNLRQIRRRIRSVENTKKITRAMEMIAAAKLKRYERILVRVRRWSEHLEAILVHLTRHASGFNHPLLEERIPAKQHVLVVVTSNMGLCGSYNADILERTEHFLEMLRPNSVHLLCIGQYGTHYFSQKGLAQPTPLSDFRPEHLEKLTKTAADEVTQSFLSGQADEVHLIHTHFFSHSSFRPVIKKILPFVREPFDQTRSIEFILEPSRERLASELVPACLTAKIHMALWESYVSEQTARMVAMRSATINAQDMIDDLILLRNKARQEAITKELIEVVTAARALKE